LHLSSQPRRAWTPSLPPSPASSSNFTVVAAAALGLTKLCLCGGWGGLGGAAEELAAAMGKVWIRCGSGGGGRERNHMGEKAELLYQDLVEIAHHGTLKSAVLAVSRRASLPKPCRPVAPVARTAPPPTAAAASNHRCT
jgi:hypothetical protein